MKGFALAFALALPALGCSRSEESAIARGEGTPLRFVPAARELGLELRHHAGRTPERSLPEIMGAGLALVDLDRDGAPDLYVVGGGRLGRRARPPQARDRLFLNDGRGRMREVSEAWGVEGSGMGMGVAAGDFDGDGWSDLYLTSQGAGDRLLANQGERLVDASERARLPPEDHWTTGAGFLDLENDGDLDLYVVRYVRYDPSTALRCYHHERHIYCAPMLFEGLPDKLLRNEGDGTFTDASVESGIAAHAGKGLALVIGDVDEDGLADVYVANDTTHNLLFMNRGDGGFDERGRLLGVAHDETGRAAAGMGADLVDLRGDGRVAIACTNFQGETDNLYEQLRPLYFRDRASALGLGGSAHRLSFGIDFFDADNDGREDLLVASGHIDDGIESVSHVIRFAQPNALYLRRADGGFEDVSEHAGPALATAEVSRGLATADLDGDRLLDFVITNNDGPLEVGRNASRAAGDALILWLEGVRANRSALGAKIEARAGERVLRREVRGASSYLSTCDLRVHLGLGDARAFDEVLVRWPGGEVQRLGPLGPGCYRVVEGRAPEPFTPGARRFLP